MGLTKHALVKLRMVDNVATSSVHAVFLGYSGSATTKFKFTALIF